MHKFAQKIYAEWCKSGIFQNISHSNISLFNTYFFEIQTVKHKTPHYFVWVFYIYNFLFLYDLLEKI